MRRSALLILPAALVLLLAGCATPAPTPVAAGAGNGWKYYGIQGSGDTGTEGPTVDGSLIGYDQLLPDGTTIEWTDVFLNDPDFTVKSADDGNGHWSYTDVTNGCALSFYQTSIDGVDPVGDESARSEVVLATFLGWTSSQLDGYTFDVPIAVSGTAGLSFDARAVTGTDDDGSDWITFARAFDVSNQAVALDVTCPEGQDATAELDALTPDYVAARIS